MVLKSPSPQWWHILQGERGQGWLFLLSFTLGRWMETSPGFAPPAQSHFSCAAFMIPWGEFPGQRYPQLEASRAEKLPLPWGDGAGGWGRTRIRVKDGRWVKDRVAHMKPPACGGVSHLLCSIPPKSDGEGFCLALRTEPTSPQFPESPGTPQTWIPLAAPSQGCLFYYNQAESRIPVITTISDGKSAISHPPAAGWS